MLFGQDMAMPIKIEKNCVNIFQIIFIHTKYKQIVIYTIFEFCHRLKLSPCLFLSTENYFTMLINKGLNIGKTFYIHIFKNASNNFTISICYCALYLYYWKLCQYQNFRALRGPQILAPAVGWLAALTFGITLLNNDNNTNKQIWRMLYTYD